MLYGDHLVVHTERPTVKDGDNALHVIGVVSNPARYQSRYRIAREWIKTFAAYENVHLTIVEAAYSERHHELADICKELNVLYVPLVTKQELWIKENMINIGYNVTKVKHPEAMYFGHIDCDVFFSNPNWAQETIHELQHFHVIQPWSDCLDLGPNGEVLQNFKSFGHQHQKRIRKQKHSKEPYQYAHSGFAWCWTREFWEYTRGLMEFPILGSADHHMAFAMIGEVIDTIHGGMHENFFELCFEWQARAVEITGKEVGYVAGRIEHKFHGPKNRRFYRERWQILVDHKYDPKKDIFYDWQGMINLKGKTALEHEIHLYNRARNEDSVDAY